MLSPLVSIIIPAYNRAHLIGETLDSVIAQTYPHWECIVVDDHSTDNTWEVVEDYCLRDARIKLLRRPEDRPKGANACRNYGFEISSGEFIQWFDSDDIMLPQKIETETKNLAMEFINNDFVVGKTAVYNFDLTLFKGYYKNDLKSKTPLTDFVNGKIGFCTTSVLFRRKFLEKIELFDEELQRAQEWDFFVRVLFFDPKYSALDKYYSIYRIHDDSISGNYRKYEYSRLYSEFKALEKAYALFKKRGITKKIDSFIIKRFVSLSIKFSQINSLSPVIIITWKLSRRYLLSSHFLKVIRIILITPIFFATKRGYTILRF